MVSFKEWVSKKDETFAVSPSIIDDEGENAEKLVSPKRPGAMPTYNSDELPPIPGKRNSKKFSRKR